MLDFIDHAAKTIYALRPSSIGSLQSPSDWRGVYHLSMANEHSWVLRLSRKHEAFHTMTHNVNVLEWLAYHHFPAPSVRMTISGENIGQLDGWFLLLHTFIDGSPSEANEGHLYLFASMLSRLHTLPLEANDRLLQPQIHLKQIQARTILQLQRNRLRIPQQFQQLAESLASAIERISWLNTEICVNHGDCWYQNGVITPNGQLRLIDWEDAHVGLAMLDLGYLLLTSHYNRARPFELYADELKIRAIMDGYQERRRLTSLDYDRLLSGVRFGLAVRLGSYVEQHDNLLKDDFMLKKFQARFDVTDSIARITEKFLA